MPEKLRLQRLRSNVAALLALAGLATAVPGGQNVNHRILPRGVYLHEQQPRRRHLERGGELREQLLLHLEQQLSMGHAMHGRCSGTPT